MAACGGSVSTEPVDASAEATPPLDTGVSDSLAESAATDAGVTDVGSEATTCNGIGAACAGAGNNCPNGLKCYAGGGTGFCGPQTNCGGFVGKACPTGLLCILPTLCADCDGTCVSPEQLSCICPADRDGAVCPDAG